MKLVWVKDTNVWSTKSVWCLHLVKGHDITTRNSFRLGELAQLPGQDYEVWEYPNNDPSISQDAVRLSADLSLEEAQSAAKLLLCAGIHP
jgi:hypothetical protein